MISGASSLPSSLRLPSTFSWRQRSAWVSVGRVDFVTLHRLQHQSIDSHRPHKALGHTRLAKRQRICQRQLHRHSGLPVPPTNTLAHTTHNTQARRGTLMQHLTPTLAARASAASAHFERCQRRRSCRRRCAAFLVCLCALCVVRCVLVRVCVCAGLCVFPSIVLCV